MVNQDKSKLKLLILIKDFDKIYLKHKMKYEMIRALEQFADVYYWKRDGDILDIIKQIGVRPDFILHYDIGWENFFSPKITNLDKIDIPKGCYVIDTHWYKKKRVDYFTSNKIDLIFSVTKDSFLKHFPTFESKFRWTPFSISPDVFKDWEQEKTIKFLLMGLVYDGTRRSPAKGQYKFREEVQRQMEKVEGFKFIRHPGHRTRKNHMVNEGFAKELNRAEIFFTCGGARQYPVMKFFEVPGCRTLLLAEPNPDILELGFTDKENFIACDSNDLYEKALYYSENEIERNKITDNGYNFIHQYHTNAVRAKQFINFMEEFIEEGK
ncbi:MULTISPECIES: glycosyltransferase [Paraliobacillus]|uniref:glycosyltransferase n=1 Tax=Paraliobacillus TaxID=200903 RepID=UPI000DD3EBC3|nr:MULTISPECIES: glycosyltransferase [Paraliobacillus]